MHGLNHPNSLIYGTTGLVVVVVVVAVVAVVAAAAAVADVASAPLRMTADRLKAHSPLELWTVNKAIYTIKPTLPFNKLMVFVFV